MLTVTGPAGLAVAEAHRRIRHDLAANLPHIAELDDPTPRRLNRIRRAVLELLEDVVIPLAVVEEAVVDLVARDEPSRRQAADAGRVEHDVVRELAAQLQDAGPGGDPESDGRVVGVLRTIGDLLPAHVDGEEHELLADLARLDVPEHEQLRTVTDELPRPGVASLPLARFHLPVPHAATVALLTDPERRAAFLPEEGTSPPATLRWPRLDRSRAQRSVPLAIIAGPDAVALRFGLESEVAGRPVTLACIDAWIEPTNDGRSSVLTFHATPPVLGAGPRATDVEVRRAIAWLGSCLSDGVTRELERAPCP